MSRIIKSSLMQIITGLLFLFFLCGFAKTTHAQSIVDRQGESNYEKHLMPWNTGSNGLSEAYVEKVFQDSKGRLYALTPEGVDIKLHDNTWENLLEGDQLPDMPPTRSANDILETKDGTIWIATGLWVHGFDSTLEKKTVLSNDNYDIHMARATSLEKDEKGRVWIGHMRRNDAGEFGEISIYHPGKDSIVARIDTGRVGGWPSSPIRDILRRDNGDMWVALGSDRFGAGIYVNRPEADTAWYYNTGNSQLPFNEVNDLAEDSHGNVWAAKYATYTEEKKSTGVARFNGQSWKGFMDLDPEIDFEGGLSVNIGPHDSVYFGNEDTMLVYDGQSWTPYPGENERFPLDGVTSMIIDENSNKIFGVSGGLDDTGGGLYIDRGKEQEDRFISPLNDGGLFTPHAFELAVGPRNHLWVGSYDGIARLKDGGWHYYNKHDGLPTPYVNDMERGPDSTLWITSMDSGLTVHKNGKLTTYDRYDNYNGKLYSDQKGNIWITSEKGLLKYNGSTFSKFPLDDLPPECQPYDIADGPNNYVYATCGEEYLIRFKNGEWTRWEPEVLPANRYYDIATDQDRNLWIPLRDSAMIWTGDQFSTQTKEDGYPGLSNLFEIKLAPDGSLWFLQSGIVHVFENGRWITIDTEERKGVGNRSIAHTPDGSTWIGTAGTGLFKYNRKKLLPVKENPETPHNFKLGNNYPNPFNPTTQIEFSLPRATDVQVTVYNMLGRRVATLLDGKRRAGEHSVTFNASDLSSGMYIYRLKADGISKSRKMLLVK